MIKDMIERMKHAQGNKRSFVMLQVVVVLLLVGILVNCFVKFF